MTEEPEHLLYRKCIHIYRRVMIEAKKYYLSAISIGSRCLTEQISSEHEV